MNEQFVHDAQNSGDVLYKLNYYNMFLFLMKMMLKYIFSLELIFALLCIGAKYAVQDAKIIFKKNVIEWHLQRRRTRKRKRMIFY